MTKNQIDYQNMLETRRSNMARETETARANRAQEGLTSERDTETARSNRAREYETNRANMAHESTERSQLAESIRTHKANEAITSAYNQARIETDRSQLAESMRHNVATEQHNINDLANRIAEFSESLNQKSLDRENARTVAILNGNARELVARINAEASRLNAQERLELDSLIRKWDMTLKTIEAVPDNISKWQRVLSDMHKSLGGWIDDLKWKYYNK